MSRWRLAVRALHELGGRADTFAIADQMIEANRPTGSALSEAKLFGLVTSERRRDGLCVWSLTTLGADFCEGRVALGRQARDGTRAAIPGKPGSRQPSFVATWLKALPMGVRL